jgi:hypothetical protein
LRVATVVVSQVEHSHDRSQIQFLLIVNLAQVKKQALSRPQFEPGLAAVNANELNFHELRSNLNAIASIKSQLENLKASVLPLARQPWVPGSRVLTQNRYIGPGQETGLHGTSANLNRDDGQQMLEADRTVSRRDGPLQIERVILLECAFNVHDGVLPW